MKYLVAALSGFAITVGVFVGGVAFAITYLSAETVPVQRPRLDASLELPTGVRRIDVAQQDYERIEERPAPEMIAAPSDVEAAASIEIDDISTAALPPQETTLNPEHVAWCHERYRSYRPDTNTYRAYSGDNRECISPFLADEIAIEAAAQSEFFNDATSAGMPRLEHVESCFARYRSYRPEDNTYQPYGGGPRVPCE